MKYPKVPKTPLLNIFAGLMTVIVLTACTAHYAVNSMITAVRSVEGYSLRNTALAAKSDELLLILTFSGGGTRAAALSYGILQALADTQIAINATDIAQGTQFTFLGDQFAPICADLSSYPVSRAVTASAAFPGPFSSIVLKNYASTF